MQGHNLQGIDGDYCANRNNCLQDVEANMHVVVGVEVENRNMDMCKIESSN